jgi:predicted dehydrogenase
VTGLDGIGAALIGGGFIGGAHLETLRRLGVPVRGILEATPELGAARAAALGLPRAYASLDDLLADGSVAVVHVTSPNALHFSQVAAVLAAGRHVVCEKPLAVSTNESAQLVRLAAEAGVVNAIDHQVRFYPLNQHLRQVIAEGGLGAPRLVSGRYLQDWLLYESDWNWRLVPEDGGGLRAVADIGSHWLDLVSFLIGDRVAEVMADLTTFIPIRHRPVGPVMTFESAGTSDTVPVEIHTEDAAAILLRFEGGARGCVTISQLSPGRKNSLTYQIDGVSSAAAWDSEQPDQLWIGHRDRPNELLLRDPGLMRPAGVAASRLPAGHAEGFNDGLRALFAAVYRAVAAGGPPDAPDYPTFADGHDVLLVLDAVAESAASGTWTSVRRSSTRSIGHVVEDSLP